MNLGEGKKINKNNNQVRTTYSGYGMAVGLIFGGLVGLLTGNIPLSAGGCMVLGYAIGAALDNQNTKGYK